MIALVIGGAKSGKSMFAQNLAFLQIIKVYFRMF